MDTKCTSELSTHTHFPNHFRIFREENEYSNEIRITPIEENEYSNEIRITPIVSSYVQRGGVGGGVFKYPRYYNKNDSQAFERC